MQSDLSHISDSGQESFLNISVDCDPSLQLLNFLPSAEGVNVPDKLPDSEILDTISTMDFGPVLTPDINIKQEILEQLPVNEIADSDAISIEQLQATSDFESYFFSSTPVKNTPIKSLTFSPSQVMFVLFSFLFYIFKFLV